MRFVQNVLKSYKKIGERMLHLNDMFEKSKNDYDPLITKKLEQVVVEYLSILSVTKSLSTNLKKQTNYFCQMMMMSHLQSPVDIQFELTQHFYQNILDMLNDNYSYDELNHKKKNKFWIIQKNTL